MTTSKSEFLSQAHDDLLKSTSAASSQICANGERRAVSYAHQILAVWGGEGTPFSSSPANSGPSSFAALVNVESRVLRDSNTKMMLVTAKRPCPMDLVTAEGCPVSTPVYMLSGILP